VSTDTFLDLDALLAIVQGNVGPRVPVAWANQPEKRYGPSGLDRFGMPIVGIPVPPNPTAPTPSGGMGGGMKVTLDVPILSQLGTDDTRRTFDTDAQAIVLTQVGWRNFTLSYTIESEKFPAALTVAERMRTRWYRKSTLAQLRAISIAMRSVGDVRSISTKPWDKRMLDAVVCEVFLRYTSTEIDDVGETTPVGNWIQTIGATGTSAGDVQIPLTLTPPTIQTVYVAPEDD
jgi:hypothetical protein